MENRNIHDHDQNDVNNDLNEEVRGLIPESRRIVDLNGWLEANGLPPPPQPNNSGHDGVANTNSNYNQDESSDGNAVDKECYQLWEQRRQYQAMIHEKLFHHDEWELQQMDKIQQRQLILNRFEDAYIRILLAAPLGNNCAHDNKYHQSMEHSQLYQKCGSFSSSSTSEIVVPVIPLAESCETIFTLLRSASTWNRRMGQRRVVQMMRTTEEMKEDTDMDRMDVADDQLLVFSLEEYPFDSVHEFMKLIYFGDQKNLTNCNQTETTSATTKTVNIVDIIPDEHVVDCCRIAHFLQNHSIVDEINKILLNSIDTSNCYALCQLADQLNLPSLFERSMVHMMRTIGDPVTRSMTATDGNSTEGIIEESAMNQTATGPNKRIRNDTNANAELDVNVCLMNEFITPELQERILQIKAAIQSSIHSQRKTIYVSSLQEYIAIFAERVQYYNERLQEATEQFEENCSNGTLQPGSVAYDDVLGKLQKQRQRVQTLRSALNEQKKLFLQQP